MSEEPETALFHSYTHAQALQKAKEWMKENYGRPMDMAQEERDRYHEKLGLLIDFLWTLHPPQ